MWRRSLVLVTALLRHRGVSLAAQRVRALGGGFLSGYRGRWLKGVSSSLALQGGAEAIQSGLPAPTKIGQQTWPAHEIYADGSCRETTLSWSELRKRVSSTDARLLLRTNALDLAIREQCVVFDLGVLRGYTDGHRAVLLVERGHEPSQATAAVVETSVRSALAWSKNASMVDDDPSFALLVLESVLEALYEHALRRIERLDFEIRRELAGMADLRKSEASRGASLYRLLPLETELRDEAVRARRVYALVADALRDDVLAKQPQHVLFGRNRTSRTVELAESVFENSLCRWEFLNDAIEKLAGTIDATRKLVELALDNERNRLERMDIHLNIAGLGMALISAIGGIFGMNLLIGLEAEPYWFNRVVFGSILAGTLVCHFFWRQFKAGYRQHADHVNVVASILHKSIASHSTTAPPLSTAPNALGHAPAAVGHQRSTVGLRLSSPAEF